MLGANPLENIENTWRIDAVIFNGRVLARADLDVMLARVEREVANDKLRRIY